MLVALDQRNRNYRREVSGNALPQAAVALIYQSCVILFLFWRTGEECGARERTGFRDNFAALCASFLMAKELLAFFGREFSNRC